jgi:hypothetical protein
MQLAAPFFQLPWRFDAARLADEIAQFTVADWRPHPQGHPGNSALPFIARHGNPLDDGLVGPMRPTPHLARCPYLMQVMAALDVPLGRSRLMRLDARAEATPHVDLGYYWQHRVRVHVPIVTFPDVQFLCGDASTHMAAGECWIFDTWRVHNVLNPGSKQRTHLVVDTVGSASFWERVGGSANPLQLAYQSGGNPSLRFETFNYPVVMAPTEIAYLCSRWMADARKGSATPEAIAELDAAVQPVFRDWNATWAQFGTHRDGWPHYARLRDRIAGIGDKYAKRVPLPNSMDVGMMLKVSLAPALLNPELAASSDNAPAEAAAAVSAVGSTTPPVIARPEPSEAAVPRAPAAPKVLAQWGISMVLRPSAHAAPVARPRLDRPLIIVGAPRSGSTLLFETLAQAPQLFTVGGESHQQFETIAALRPAANGYRSGRLDAADATPAAVDELHARFWQALRDRDGRRPESAAAPRLLEKTPKNALRLPFLEAAFADAQYVYLYRDPQENISSMIEGWESGLFVMYPELPGWRGRPWSFLLVPGWRDLIGADVPAIAAAQWLRTQTVLLDDLEGLPSARVHAVTYDEFLASPSECVRGICRFANVPWDRPLPPSLPLSRHTVTPPHPDKWRRHEALIAPHRAELQVVADRARRFIAGNRTGAARAAAATHGD